MASFVLKSVIMTMPPALNDRSSMPPELGSARGCRVATTDLLREVDEYFASGAQVAPGQTVVDVGANIGAFALRVAERCHSDVRILCVEPAPATYRALQGNFQDNPLLSKTRHSLFPVGLLSAEYEGKILSFYNFLRFDTNSTFDLLGKRREFEMFFEDRARRLSSQPGPLAVLGRILGRLFATSLWRAMLWWLLRYPMGLRVGKAPVTTLSRILRRARITRVDLLKIDAEGAELEVLLGLDAQTWPLVQQVIIETHNRDGRQDKIAGLMLDHGLTELQVNPQRTIDNGLESVILVARRPGRLSRAGADSAREGWGS
jgi:hypothetical protein